jgi:hypothetical protein
MLGVFRQTLSDWVGAGRFRRQKIFCPTEGGGVPGFEPADFGLADSVKFLEGQGASAAVGGQIGRESGDALEEVFGSGIEIEDHRFLRLSAARRGFGKGAPGGRLFILGHKNAACGFRISLQGPPRKALSRGHGGVWRVFAPWRYNDPLGLGRKVSEPF